MYDHESDEPRRRRRAAADWGVNEDIFDRMPSRVARFERRAEHHDIVLRRDETDASVAVIEQGEPPVRGAVSARTERSARSGETGALDPRAAARAMMSWGADLDDDTAPMVPGETRTIVLSRDAGPGTAADTHAQDYDDAGHDPRAYDELMLDGELARDTKEYVAAGGEVRERRTIKISGHPDRLPAPRTQRAPRTAVERIGHRPDRIAAYAVALGFLLVLIAVLTTGQ
ncbi:hypothetical protein DVA67_027670 [Solirubrobacter sp. CPCC 204708]|uniref:Uncharacterized protein n=1 Tax=Solirubrobacter deserti TaxID=2282478 RepID=A0ABT4RJN9_9ACTN|nr:hypothetical protein [Solirubrobacter deserti]MBE2319779.1 hypothetical protein [Solirubrobacter deserti]MDA0138738.1 hypothetical protein [Solirubrobacter deserti]